jgi:putative transcriptional regulator
MKKLKTLREQHGLSQGELAKRVGVSRFTILDYENGRRSPTFAMCQKFAEEFNCTMNDLGDDSNPPQPPLCKTQRTRGKRGRAKTPAA